jgi:hypothetical protein
MHTLKKDLHYGMRMLLKSPGFTFFVVVTLGLGIGLNTAIFSLINALLLRPLPFEGVERIVALDRGDFGDFFSYLDYTEYRDRSGVFESLSAWSYAPISVGSGQATELRFGQIVTGDYFQTLAVDAALGRVLTPEDDKVEGGHPVAVLSHPFWRRAWGGSSSVLGEVVSLNGHPFRIIGVAPEGFVGAFPAFTPDVWVPMMMEEQIMPDGGGRLDSRHGGWLRVIGRLKSDISMQQASARIDQVAEHLVEIDPERYKDETAFITQPNGIGLPPEARPMVLGLSVVIMSMVGMVLLVGFTQSGNDYWVEGRPPRLDEDGEEDPDSSFQSIVSDGDFETLGISLLRGRDFNEFDVRDGPGVVIVNQALADRNWPGESALGQRISIESTEGPFLEIVGVASTVKYIFIGEQPRPFLYLPFSQNYDPNMNLLVRASGDPMALLPAVRSVIRDLNPDVSPADTRILSGWIGFALLPAKLAAMLFGLFGVVAVLIASVGLYGVMSYTAGQRTREIGIRVALGAQRGDVLRLILRQGLVLTVVGLGLGLVVSFGGTRVLSALLYDVSVTDPIAFVGVSVLLLAVASLACYVPAHRATKVDPIVALRYE